ncbi:MAG: hypothetical protein J0H84_25125 [Rhizobiales bacterium]|jgi:hypothetical protein|nr:hypothetical protein [Hyphomicrobiales bacterium]
MRRLLIAIALLLIGVTISSAASVELVPVRTSPSDDDSLPRFGTLYIEISYHSDVPLRLQARAFANGLPADAGQAMNASVVHPAGDGEALVWVSFSKPTLIDEVRTTAYDENWEPVTTLSIARSIRWLSEPAATSKPLPDWVRALIAAESQIAHEYSESHPPAPDPVGTILTMFVFLSVPGYFLLQGASLITQRGRWWLAGLVPLAIMVPAALHAIYALSAGSNLWPLVFIFASPLGFLYLTGLFVVRWSRNS